MKITGIEFRYFRIPLAETLVSAKLTLTHREVVAVEIRTDAAVTGVGWFVTPGTGASAALILARDYMVPMLIGEDPRNHEKIWEMLWMRCHFAGPGGLTTLAMAGIDVALWDIKGKVTGEPLHRLLGGSRETVRVYASNINLHLSVEKMLEQTESQLLQGYDAFKMKVGKPDAEEDLERMRAVRKLIGSGRELMLDANQKWRSGEAVQRCAMLAEVNPSFIEEPVLSDDVSGHARLRAQSSVPVAVGEQLSNKYEFWNYVREGAADVLQPCVSKLGGITEWLKVSAMTQTANLVLSPHGSLELTAHLAAAVPYCEKIENVFSVSLYALGMTTVPPAVKNGSMELSPTPGHGIVLDGPALKEHRVEL